jgi:uncharacterized protein (DUF3084 family)
MNDTPTPSPFATDGQRTTDAECWMNYCLEAEKGLTAVTEQRDDLQMQLDSSCNAEELRQFRAERDVAREALAELNQEYGTWWAQKRIALDELKDVTEQRDRLAKALQACREDSVELLGERCFWQNEPRCDYDKRYQETRNNVTRANEALQSLTPNEL